MADLALLADLDELGNDEEQQEAPVVVSGSKRPREEASEDVGTADDGSRKRAHMADGGAARDDADGEHDAGDADSDDMDEDDADAAAAAAAGAPEHPEDTELEAQLATAGAGVTGYRTVAKLRHTARFRDHMSRVAAALDGPPITLPAMGGLLRWSEYPVILASNIMTAAALEETAQLHAYVARAFAQRFPELEAIIPSPLDYIRAVQVVQNEADLTTLQQALGRIMPSATVMVVTLTASSTSGKALDAAALADVLSACEEALELESCRARLLAYVSSRMHVVAPNTVALLGTSVAAQLMGIAGGMDALAALPGSTIQVLGQKKRIAAGLGRFAGTNHAGVIFDCELIQGAPVALRRKAARTLAPKVALSARMDAHRQYVTGDFGAALKSALQAKLVKWQEPPPGRNKKALPAPDDKKSKHRGGRRARALKAKMGMTDVRKEANRVTFGASSSIEYGDMVMGRDIGMLGEQGSGRLRVERKPQNILKKKRTGYAGSSGATGGAASSLVLASSQGIELLNPAAKLEHMKKLAEDAAGYFSTTGVFSQIPRAAVGRKT